MQLQLSILLLCISKANLIACARSKSVKFVAEALIPDLEAIAKYHNLANESIEAFIHWPHQIDFNVQKFEFKNEEYLKLEGKFKRTVLLFFFSSFRNLYYRQGQFYVHKRGKMKPLSNEGELHYEQTIFKREGESYLSIRYRVIDEVIEAIRPFYTDHRFYMDSYSLDKPSTYLATWGEPAENFLEYTTWNRAEMGVVEGGLQILIGKVDKNTLIVSGYGTSTRLVFHQTTKVVTIDRIRSRAVPAPSTQNVLGFRMASVGCLTEVRKGIARLLSSDAFDAGTNKIPSRYKILMSNFVKKLRTVEPKICPVVGRETCFRFQPKMSKFQIHGHVLVKRVNYVEDEEIDPECPIVIEYEREGPEFLIGAVPTTKICTDNRKLWGGTYSRLMIYIPKLVITLFHPKSH